MFSALKWLLSTLVFLMLLETEAKTLLETLLDYPEPLNLDREKSERIAREWEKYNKGSGKSSQNNFFDYQGQYDDNYEYGTGQQTIDNNGENEDYGQFVDQQHVYHDQSPPTIQPLIPSTVRPIDSSTECPDDVPTYRVYGLIKCGVPIEEISEQNIIPEAIDDYSPQIHQQTGGQTGYWSQSNHQQQGSFQQPGFPGAEEQQQSNHGQVSGVQSGTNNNQDQQSHISSYEDYKEGWVDQQTGQESYLPEENQYQQTYQQTQTGRPYQRPYYSDYGQEQRNDILPQQHYQQPGGVVQNTGNRPISSGSRYDFDQQRFSGPIIIGQEPVDENQPQHGQQLGQFDCFQRQEGYYPDYNSDCRKFYRCATGHFQAYEFTCGPGTKFDEVRLFCDYADNVYCGRRLHSG